MRSGPRQRQNRLSEDVVLQLVASYLGGSTFRELARDFVISETTVLAHLRRLEVPPRPYRKLKYVQAQEAVRLYQAGQSLKVTAHEVGASVDATRRALVEAGVTIRSKRVRSAN